MAVGTIVGALAVVSGPQASAAPAGPLATAEFGVAFKDQGGNGQCQTRNGENPVWRSEGEWTEAVAVDTDSRPGGCEMQFALNNVDGSLAGVNFYYWFIPGNTGQCQGTQANKTQIPIFPFAFRYFFMSPIVVNSDNRVGGCELTLALEGRSDVALDVRWETNSSPDNGQCPGADPLGANQPRTITDGHALSVFFETDDRGGACFISFRLRHF